ncbi:hypothetical protein BDV95DRAFT_593653 [Massariosphaeria phaeospora]|uniref:Uncharacterized protein n=1 Tax=Massariosphaeria phaeospora TaxID=100035 RepID=A0A7C8MCW7_9PLEO|nr:hypothetical protein BDV95DRAFT_593653 [Massariosphaeria phaeospora]
MKRKATSRHPPAKRPIFRPRPGRRPAEERERRELEAEARENERTGHPFGAAAVSGPTANDTSTPTSPPDGLLEELSADDPRSIPEPTVAPSSKEDPTPAEEAAPDTHPSDPPLSPGHSAEESPETTSATEEASNEVYDAQASPNTEAGTPSSSTTIGQMVPNVVSPSNPPAVVPASAPAPTAPAPLAGFFDLPVELRQTVYDLVFDREGCVFWKPGAFGYVARERRQNWPRVNPLSAVCRQFRAETEYMEFDQEPNLIADGNDFWTFTMAVQRRDPIAMPIASLLRRVYLRGEPFGIGKVCSPHVLRDILRFGRRFQQTDIRIILNDLVFQGHGVVLPAKVRYGAAIGLAMRGVGNGMGIDSGNDIVQSWLAAQDPLPNPSNVRLYPAGLFIHPPTFAWEVNRRIRCSRGQGPCELQQVVDARYPGSLTKVDDLAAEVLSWFERGI